MSHRHFSESSLIHYDALLAFLYVCQVLVDSPAHTSSSRSYLRHPSRGAHVPHSLKRTSICSTTRLDYENIVRSEKSGIYVNEFYTNLNGIMSHACSTVAFILYHSKRVDTFTLLARN